MLTLTRLFGAFGFDTKKYSSFFVFACLLFLSACGSGNGASGSDSLEEESLPLVAKSQLELRGQVGISYMGGPEAVLVADPIYNLSAKDSREVRIEYWYVPPPGVMTNFIGSYKAAQFSVGIIPRFGSVGRTVSGGVPHKKPPSGTWKEVIVLTERIGIEENDGFAIQTTVVFSGTLTF